MKLVLIYGLPAVGKLTVARELAARTGGRLFHNHLAVNVALSLYPFGSPGFVELRETIWRDVFRRALAERMPLVIFTFNPEDSVPQTFIDALLAAYATAGAEIVPVELTAGEAAIEARLGDASRRREGKTLDAAAYRDLRRRGVFARPVMPPPRLVLNTEEMAPVQAAERIARLL